MPSMAGRAVEAAEHLRACSALGDAVRQFRSSLSDTALALVAHQRTARHCGAEQGRSQDAPQRELSPQGQRLTRRRARSSLPPPTLRYLRCPASSAMPLSHVFVGRAEGGCHSAHARTRPRCLSADIGRTLRSLAGQHRGHAAWACALHISGVAAALAPLVSASQLPRSTRSAPVSVGFERPRPGLRAVGWLCVFDAGESR